MRIAALALLAALAAAPTARAGDVAAARFAGPTDRYPHGALGDPVEWGALELTLADGAAHRITLAETRVFEDTVPRLADLDQDGRREALVVEADAAQGARLVAYGADGARFATPFIGTRFRWRAPVGIADLDQDGRLEIAEIDRPHLARILRVWRVEEGKMVEVASLSGLTNHRFGDPDIPGGVRDCGFGPELVVAEPSWQELRAVRLADGELSARRLPGRPDADGFAKVLACAPPR